MEDVDKWVACMAEYKSPTDQLAALRQGIIQNAWAGVITSNFMEGSERYPHMEDGKFNFKSPFAETEAGRSKA